MAKLSVFQTFLLKPEGTAFQQAIWQALREIDYGELSSYGELALRINNPKAVRAVGGAVGSNPISIIIPCHRILGKDRTLTGFGGGLEAKRFLLQLEKIPYIDKGTENTKPRFFKKISRMIPQTLEQLLSQAQSIAGLTFGEFS
ncbi:methylated-DNA-protein-cysteine methyltransferase [Haemophilus influenzae]|uniref:methylated-DNA--[protein]-cysteine S-methyltransferase n=1 Tax=Haemophilus influenzae TaxID=727 RepID=A0A2X1PXE2_HAEIF|nr:methylated-DNA-protein-cysteine methyltransferase [Haemophilus influenzae]